MFVRLARPLAMILSAVIVGLAVMPAAAAPITPPTIQSLRCIPFTNICSNGTLWNNSSSALQIYGNPKSGGAPIERTLASGQDSLRTDIKDVDFVWSNQYALIDMRSGTPYAIGQRLKIPDFNHPTARDGVRNGIRVIEIHF